MCSEKVSLLQNNCIFLEGKGRHLTIITYNDHEATDQSATFTSYGENVIVKGITFKVNIYKIKLQINYIFSS